jgi:hypothetical protein
VLWLLARQRVLADHHVDKPVPAALIDANESATRAFTPPSVLCLVKEAR